MSERIILFMRMHRMAMLGAVVVFLLVASLGESILYKRTTDLKEEHFRDSMTFSAKLRARVESELNSMLYLSSGLGSYLVVRHDDLKADEVNEILSVLFKSSGHIRNFGVAVGYTIKYVYPHAGNEGAIGLYYPDHPKQWPMVQKVAESGMPALAGPVNLVQGGRGLVYRVPLFIGKRYWGLLSTVIDLDSFAESIVADVERAQFEFAITGSDGMGANGDMVLGHRALFDRDDVYTQEVSVPGGSWVIAVRSARDTGIDSTSLMIRLLTYALAVMASWMMYMLIRSRSDLATLAMYDQLTGLPNRHLLEDRAEMSFARHKRNPEQNCAILFLDLDGFKHINDHHGHKAGDAVLRAVADRASAVMRENDTVARWGGDEFIVLMDDANPAGLQQMVERLRNEIEAPILFEGATLQVGVSVGIAMCQAAGGNLDQILKQADRQMYAEKMQRKAA